MKISIITTIYKAEKDLPRLLDSMMAQKSEELEFFLIDNGSPDNCGKICKEYAKRDSRFVICTLKDNIGYIRARNYGIEHCDGDYIGFCDSDDYLEVGGYDTAIEKIKQFDCDLYITSYNTIFENKNTVNLIPYKKGLYEGNEIEDLILPQAFGCLNGKSALHGFAWKQIFKRDLILKNNISFMTELQPYEDQIFNIDVIKVSNKIYIDDNTLYNYIVNENSITAKLVTNFDASTEWNRIVLFWKEKMRRATEQIHIDACSNQALDFIYSMILNMAKSSKSNKQLVVESKTIFDRDIIDKILKNTTNDLSFRLRFIKFCLHNKLYFLLFGVIVLILK